MKTVANLAGALVEMAHSAFAAGTSGAGHWLQVGFFKFAVVYVDNMIRPAQVSICADEIPRKAHQYALQTLTNNIDNNIDSNAVAIAMSNTRTTARAVP